MQDEGQLRATSCCCAGDVRHVCLSFFLHQSNARIDGLCEANTDSLALDLTVPQTFWMCCAVTYVLGTVAGFHCYCLSMTRSTSRTLLPRFTFLACPIMWPQQGAIHEWRQNACIFCALGASVVVVSLFRVVAPLGFRAFSPIQDCAEYSTRAVMWWVL